jgi:hypothetical protein
LGPIKIYDRHGIYIARRFGVRWGLKVQALVHCTGIGSVHDRMAFTPCRSRLNQRRSTFERPFPKHFVFRIHIVVKLGKDALVSYPARGWYPEKGCERNRQVTGQCAYRILFRVLSGLLAQYGTLQHSIAPTPKLQLQLQLRPCARLDLHRASRWCWSRTGLA